MSDSPADDPHVRNVLGALALAVADLLEADAAAHGRTGLEQAALVLLRTLPGMSQSDLQRRLGLSQPGTTRLVDRLTTRGLVIRRPGRDDRTHALRLTTLGAAQAGAAEQRRHAILGRATHAVTSTQAHVVTEALDAMLASLVEHGSSPYRTCRLCDQRACTSTDRPCPAEPSAAE